MNDATLDLSDVTGLSGVALLFAYDSLRVMSDRALRQGDRKQSTHLYRKWQEVAKEVEKRDLIGAYTQIKLLDLKLQQAHAQPKRLLN